MGLLKFGFGFIGNKHGSVKMISGRFVSGFGLPRT